MTSKVLKDTRNIVVLDMGINALSVLRLLKQELKNETIIYLNDLEINNYEGMEIFDIERRIKNLIDRVLKYNPKLLLIANDTLIEYGREMFDKLELAKVYVVDEIIEYVNSNYELKNIAFFAPQGIIESNMYQKKFKYTRLYNINADNMMNSLNNALMKTSDSFKDMKLALLPIYKKELDVIVPTLPNLLLFQTEIYEYVKSRDVDIIPLDKILVEKTKNVLKEVRSLETNVLIDSLKQNNINVVLGNSENIERKFLKGYVLKDDCPLKRVFSKIIGEKYNIIVEKAEI